MKKSSFSLVAIAGALAFGMVLAGCGQKPAAGPSKGTLGLDNLPPDQQIAKVQADKNIPDQYKQTYINSIRAKSGQGAVH